MTRISDPCAATRTCHVCQCQAVGTVVTLANRKDGPLNNPFPVPTVEGKQMRALKVVQHMKTNADRMSEGLLQKIRGSDRCGDLLQKVSRDEHKRYAHQIYIDVTEWLGNETDAVVEKKYAAMGMQRAQQGVPLTNVFWAVCIARDYLWDYIQQECLLEEPAEFWGGVNLLRSLNQFFDRALYFTLIGYHNAGKDALKPAPAAFA